MKSLQICKRDKWRKYTAVQQKHVYLWTLSRMSLTLLISVPFNLALNTDAPVAFQGAISSVWRKGEDIILDSYGVRFSLDFRSLDQQQLNDMIPTFLQREKQQNPIKSCKNITITTIETS